MLTQFLRRAWPWAWLATLAAGCTTAAPPARAPREQPAPMHADTVAPARAARQWTPRRIAGTNRYEVRSSTTVSLTSDSAATPAPIETRAVYTVTLTGTGALLALSGSLDSLAIHTGGRVPTPAPIARLPVLLSGQLDDAGHLSGLTAATKASCAGGLDPAVALAAALFPAVPTVHVGSAWQDTVVTVTCRGNLALRTVTSSSYRVAADTTVRGRPALEVILTAAMNTASDTTGQGSAAAGVSISGSGTAQRTAYVDAATGLLLHLSGTSQSTITVRTRTTTLPFRQDVTETIDLR